MKENQKLRNDQLFHLHIRGARGGVKAGYDTKGKKSERKQRRLLIWMT